jgi:hypothetical protein
MRSLGLLLLSSCAAPVTIAPVPASQPWILVQHEAVDRRAGDAMLQPGPAIFLCRAEESGVLEIEPVRTQFAVHELVRVRVAVRPDAPDEFYEVRLILRSAGAALLSPDRAQVRRGRSAEFRLTCDAPGAVEMEFEADALQFRGWK